jgi:3-hydroxyisobutyrate dehydrogenase-like beta-hydroxyacid dehydrogenase
MKAILGCIGIGSMGAPIARNLLRGGHEVVVCDVDSEAMAALVEAGAQRAASPADVARQADIGFLCLPTLESITAVAFGDDGLIHGDKLRICVNFSTVGPTFVEQLGSQFASHAIALLDCPITGGALSARDGTLSITVSGAQEVYQKLVPVLQTLSRHLFYVGERPGQAQLMKLINNMLSFTAFVASCEAFVLGVKAGLDPDAMVAVINTGTGRNSATTDKFPNNILPRTFDYGAKLAISRKDIALCLGQAERFGVPMWVGNTIRQMIEFGAAQSGDDVDITRLIHHYEKWAGVEVIGRERSASDSRGASRSDESPLI